LHAKSGWIVARGIFLGVDLVITGAG